MVKNNQHIVYNLDKTIKGIEEADFVKGSELAAGSTFKDGQDSLLSYYTFTFDDKDRLYKKIGFDASNDEMLRIEIYHHDKTDQLVAKEIRSADDQIQSVYNYTYDLYGNEESIKITNQDNVVVYTEKFENTSFDKEKKWDSTLGIQ